MKKFLLYCSVALFVFCAFVTSFVVLQKRTSAFWFSAWTMASSAKHVLLRDAIKINTYPTRLEMLYVQVKLGINYVFFPKPAGTPLHQHIGQYDVYFRDYCEMMFLVDEVFAQKLYFFSSKTQTPFIIDCGSHIGTTVLFFKSLYPQAKIIAIEPDDRNFALLTKNIEVNKLSNVTTINKALHDHNGTISFYLGGWSTTESSIVKYKTFSGEAQVACMPLSELITEPVDFLKMDIEGAESIVFDELESKGKLPLIKEMVIEYHHHMNKTEDTLAHFLAILEKNHFGYQIRQGGHASIFDKMTPQSLIVYAYQKDLLIT